MRNMRDVHNYAEEAFLWNLFYTKKHLKKLRRDQQGKNLIDLEVFVSVVDHGSVVAASASLHLTQPAVSRRVQNQRCTSDTSPRAADQAFAADALGKETYEFARPVLSSVGDLKVANVHDGGSSADFRCGVLAVQ